MDLMRYVRDTRLSADVRRLVATYLAALADEVGEEPSPRLVKAETGLKKLNPETRTQIVAAFEEVQANLPHDLFERGSEVFTAELAQLAKELKQPALVPTAGRSRKAARYMAQVDDGSLTTSVRDLLEQYFAVVSGYRPEGAQKVIRQAEVSTRAAAVLALLEAYGRSRPASEYDQHFAAEAARALLNQKVQFDEKQVKRLAQLLPRGKRAANNISYPVYLVLKAILAHAEQHGASHEVRSALEAVQEPLQNCYEAHGRRAARRIADLLSDDKGGAGTGVRVLQPGDRWAERALADLAAMSARQRQAWAELLNHANTSGRNKATAGWLQKAGGLFSAVGAGPFLASAGEWFTLVGPGKLGGVNSDTLRGVVQYGLLLAPAGEDEALEAISTRLAELAEACFRRADGGGLVSSKVGLACLETLGLLPNQSAAVQLARLKRAVKNEWARGEAVRVLEATLAAKGLNLSDLEESCLPAYGFVEVGKRRETFGTFTAELTLAGASAELSWFKADGSLQKSEPAGVKRDHAKELTAFKKAGKDAAKLLGSQRDRFDRFYLERKEWPFEVWRQRYLDHPLLGTLARRLIWSFATGNKIRTGAWHEGRLVGWDDKVLKLPAKAVVHLWHPLDKPEERSAWRDWLVRHDVRQPFKQAHREVYVLTDAERTTGSYSNRFAGHILKQHQFNALRGQRGWDYNLMGHWDSLDRPTLRVPVWNLRAEFFVEATGNDEASPAGVLLYVASDQVRFYRGEEPLELEAVPALPFSEIMRDVDLFVGVCSIGNDPTWADRGNATAAARAQFGDYWQSFSYGDLNATARTRAEVLQRLVPRLKIADRCSFDEPFLVVRGDLRTYKIHMGSSNILMEPGAQYLCIVEAPRPGLVPKLMLPFEGDETLSLILSKAFLLSDDAQIQDPAIRKQIARE